MEALARTLENAAHCLEMEAEFLAAHHQRTDAAWMRKRARVLREKAARCHLHAHTLKYPTPRPVPPQATELRTPALGIKAGAGQSPISSLCARLFASE